MNDQISSKTDLVYRYVRQRILSLEFAPGSFIDKTEICAKLDVSRQPVTTALIQLSREGLVEILPQRGSYVSRLDLTYLRERLYIRMALEATLAGDLAEKRPPEVVAALRALAEGQADPDQIDLETINERFHRTIASATSLAAVHQEIEAGLMCLRRVFSIVNNPRSGIVELLNDHRRIVEAIERGDRSAAAEMMRDHGRAFMQMIEQLSVEQPRLFLQV